ncbi:MAG: terminase large subunit [Oscillospiraceae bacterium]|nr:terminase large subunit [Oscillospiraceae bacterium]
MIDRVTEYAKKVVSGAVVCGTLHLLACQRHLHDLDRQRTEAFPFYWDVDASQEIIHFAESLRISEGTEVKPLRLMDCQAFDLGSLFGWKKTVNGKRRFRRRYKSISRQQGKTMENGIIAAYLMAFSGYHKGKLFTVATKKRQSRLAWEETRNFIEADPDLLAYFRIQDYKSMITAHNTGCTLEALSKDSGLDDGFRSIYSSIDELHQHRDNRIYKAIYNGTRSLPETLVSMITTRGDNLSSFCKEMDDYAVKILRGLTTAEDFFVDIYCMDSGDDIWDEKNWAKSCPFSVMDSERLAILRQDAQTAKDMGGMDLRDFVCKCLNMWVKNTDNQYIDPDKWKECGSSRTLHHIANDQGYRQAYAGVDLSSGGDLTSIALVFPMGENKFYIWSHSFMPRGRMNEHIETDIAPYDLWERQKLITVTGGESCYMNDYKFIIRYLHEIQDTYHLQFLGIGIDVANAAGVLQDLDEFGCRVVTITQSARNLNSATVAIQLYVKGQQIEYDKDNELLTWSFMNAAVVRDSYDNIKIDKRRVAGRKQENKRIDPVDAVIDAFALMLIDESDSKPVNVSDELDEYLKLMKWR